MASIGALLVVLAPAPDATAAALEAPQQLVDASGAGALLVAVIAALAWLTWAWGALGLLLTAAGALPGLAGWTARQLVRVVLPASARRAAALALGIGVAVSPPLFAVTALAAPPAAPSTTDLAVPDWPGAAAPAVPDWPTTGAPDGAAAPHVVVHGDCLWRIAADRLQGTTGAPATDGQVARAVDAWWTTNASVIGPDPDLLLPGQVLRSPGSP